MNLEESDSYKDEIEKNTRHRKSVMLSIILCAFLVALLFIMIMILKYQDSITEKMFIDKKQVSIPNGFYRDIDGKRYVNLKELASLLGYNYTKGVYGEYNENEDSAYMQNNFEILAVTADSEEYSKYIEIDEANGEGNVIAEIPVVAKEANGYSETFTTDTPVKFVDGILYVCANDIPEMFNLQLDWQEYRINFYTLNYIVGNAKNVIGKLNYSQISGYYENLRALIYGYAVVSNGNVEEGKGTPSKDSRANYGVVSLADGKEVISLKYDDIKFVQNAKEFYVTVANGTMGILGADGSTIIAPSEFEDISLLDDKTQLYLVKKGSEYGVLNRKGKVIVYAENDAIGVDLKEFPVEEIDNGALLFGKCIPVEKDAKFGLSNIDGEILLNTVYDGLGYKSDSTSKTSGSEESVLVIPSSVGINGIVINQNDLYGIYDVNEQSLILPTVATKIYSITKSGKRTYYFEYDGQQVDLKQYLIDNGLNNVKEEEKDKDNKEENENTNEVATNTVENSNDTVTENTSSEN